jgi:hypothetical protein
MIDDEFEVCFELLLSFVLAKRRMFRVPVRAYMPVPYPGGAKKKKEVYSRIYIELSTWTCVARMVSRSIYY